MAKKYQNRVTGAAAVLVTADGSERYLYRGAVVPAGFTDESIKHAISAGLVTREEVAPSAEEVAAEAAAAQAKVDAEAKAKADADAKAAAAQAK